VLSPLEMHSKTQIYAGNTKYQRVDVWDIVEVRSSGATLGVSLYTLLTRFPLSRGKNDTGHGHTVIRRCSQVQHDAR
jgi:hypothetical protein